MDIESVIAEAQKAQPTAEASNEAPATSEILQETEVTEAKEDIGVKPDSELTPEQLAKRESNRRSHQASREARLKREVRELREFQQKVLQQQQKPNNQNTADGRPVKPVEDNFQTWEELEAAKEKYYEDLADWKVDQKLAARNTQAQNNQTQPDNQKAERISRHVNKEAEFAKQVPDYEATVYGEYPEFMSDMPAAVAQALFEADPGDVSPAIYALAREGLLESLESLSPAQMGIAIGKAAIRGAQYINQNKVTNAPSPTRSARGTGTYAKPLMDLPMEDLLKKVSTRE